MSSLVEILSNNGLGTFIDKFMSEGIYSVSDAKLLTDGDLKELGMNMGQRNRFKDQLRRSGGVISINQQPTIEDQERYNEIFDAIDADHSGEVDFEEFLSALKKLGIYQSDTDAKRIFDEGDKDGGGTLDRDEFIMMLHSASSDGRGSRLEELTKAGSSALDQLKDSTGLSFNVEDVLNAPVTEEAWDEAKKYSDANSYTWVPNASSCSADKNCNLFWNILVVDLDLCKKLVEVACTVLLEGLEEKLKDCGMTGFVAHCVQFDAVARDALRIFAMIVHRYSHLTPKDKSYALSPAGMSYLHSFRKAACLCAAEGSIQDVRETAVELLERRASSNNRSYSSLSSSSSSMSKSLRNGAMVGIGESVGAEIAGQVLSNACNIM